MSSLRLYFRFISIRMRAQMQYPTAFLLDVASTGFGTLIAFITIAAVLQRFDNIGGWRLGEIAFLYGLVEFPFATMDMIFSAYDPGYFGNSIVRRGQLDQMLLRPLSLPLQIFGAEFQLRRLGRMAQGLAVFIFSIHLAQPHWTLAKMAYLPVVMLSTIAFFGGLFVFGSTMCFWTVESIEIINVFTYGGTEMLSYPMHIYNEWLQRFFTFVVPAALLVYYPTLYFLDKPDPLGMPTVLRFLAPLAGFGFLAAAFTFWKLGLKYYQSTGT